MNTIDKNDKNEIIVNKSKFITYINKVNNLNDVDILLKKIKDEFKDATHICYAYQIGTLKKAYDDDLLNDDNAVMFDWYALAVPKNEPVVALKYPVKLSLLYNST